MKGIVVEKNSKFIIIMKPDGTFEKVKNSDNIDIGKEIIVPDIKSKNNVFYKYASVAAAVLIMSFGSYNVYTYCRPYGSLNIDINPSVQLDFNKFDRVIGVSGLNLDGQTLIGKMDNLKNVNVESAAQKVVDAAMDYNYIKENEDNDVMLSVYTPDENKKNVLKNKVNTLVNNYVQTRNKKVSLISEGVSKNEIAQAKANNVSVGKLLLYQKAKAVDPSVTLDEIKQKKVKDIVKIIKGKSNNSNSTSTTETNKVPKNPKSTTEPKNTTNPKTTDDPQINNTTNPGNAKNPTVSTPIVKNPIIEEKLNEIQNEIKNSTADKLKKKTIPINPITPDKSNQQSSENVRDRTKAIRERINKIINQNNN